jgi:hypothetical protein
MEVKCATSGKLRNKIIKVGFYDASDERVQSKERNILKQDRHYFIYDNDSCQYD